MTPIEQQEYDSLMEVLTIVRAERDAAVARADAAETQVARVRRAVGDPEKLAATINRLMPVDVSAAWTLTRIDRALAADRGDTDGEAT